MIEDFEREMQVLSAKGLVKLTLRDGEIRRIAAENPMMKWYHFGDLDPDGFFILEHLKRGTGLAFEAFHMGIEDLERYRDFGKSLEENDRKKAETLMARGLYREELSYMLQENIKLEQEIISWKEKELNNLTSILHNVALT